MSLGPVTHMCVLGVTLPQLQAHVAKCAQGPPCPNLTLQQEASEFPLTPVLSTFPKARPAAQTKSLSLPLCLLTKPCGYTPTETPRDQDAHLFSGGSLLLSWSTERPR